MSRRLSIFVWLALIIVAVPFAMRESRHLTIGGYTAPSSQSAHVENALAHNSPQLSHADLAVFLWARRGATSTELEAAITRVEHGLHGIRGVTLSSNAIERARFAAGLVGPIVIPLTVENSSQKLVAEVMARLPVRTPKARHVETHLLGESVLGLAVAAASKKELAEAERVGFPLFLVVLIVVFGSIGAAVLPLTIAAVTLIIGGAAIYLLSLVTELSTFTTNTASLFGIGVAIDYSLIVLTRIRQELFTGQDMATAQRIASQTAGRAVLFSGITVILSLAAVWTIPIVTLRSMAAGAMITVGIAVLLSVTLLPVLCLWLGGARLTTRRSLRTPFRGEWFQNSWTRWTTVVTRRPLLVVATVCTLLLPLCIPAASMTTNIAALQQLPKGDSTRLGFEELQRLQGPGSLSPMLVLLHSSDGVSSSVLHRVAITAQHFAHDLTNVREVGLLHLSSEGSYAIFSITPAVDSESQAATRLMSTMRRSFKRLSAKTGIDIAVGGETANQVDEVQSISDGMWKLIAAVLLVSFVILVVLLRSIVLPLKAIVMNVISVGIAYGVLVIVFQWGWFDELLHYNAPGHVYPLVPPLLLAVVFGLSMDYEIFLLTRIREHWDRCGNQREAIGEGLAKSAGAITSAAFILVCVFSVFITIGNPTVKELGVGAAVAVGIDATLIRLILVPATMMLLGRWNWWFPKTLDRMLPSFEAAHRPQSAVLEQELGLPPSGRRTVASIVAPGDFDEVV